MRHHPPTTLIVGLTAVLFLLPAPPSAWGAGDPSRKWTHGRSVCDSGARLLLDTTTLTAVDRQPLEQALDFAIQDVDSLGALTCFSEAETAAVEMSARLRSLQEEVMPGVRATSCEGGARPKALRLAMVQESSLHMRDSEAFLEDAFERYDRIQHQITAALPAGGVPFDDCRAKAQRGWARARTSLNRLSCELKASLERMTAFQDRAEQTGLAALECSAPPVAQAAPAATAATVMVVAPVKDGYQPVTGVEPAAPEQKP